MTLSWEHHCPSRPALTPTLSPKLVVNHVFRGAWPPVGPVPPPGVFGFHVERDDLDLAAFDRVGGPGPMFQVFGCQVDPLLTGLNEVLAGCPPAF